MKKGISSQFYLLKQLAVMKCSKPVEEHLLRFEWINKELASAGIVVHEWLVVLNLLQTLPNSFQQLVIVLVILPAEQYRLLSNKKKQCQTEVNVRRSGGNVG